MTALPGPSTSRRRGGASALLAIAGLMLAVTVSEVVVILQTGRLIGPLWTLGLLVVMGFVGAWLWKREGIRAWRAVSNAFESGKLPAGELTDAALVLVGGILLMLPGFLSDLLGLFFLLPLTRPLARRLVAAVVARTAARRGLDLGVLRARADPGSVIVGETVDSGQATPRTQQSAPIVIEGEIERS